MAQTTLHDLVATIASAVGTAQDLVERNYLAMVRRYFDDEGRPLSMSIKLPSLSADPSEAERQVVVPVLSLVDSRALGIKSVDVTMDVALDDLDVAAPGDGAANDLMSGGAPLEFLNVGPQAAADLGADSPPAAPAAPAAPRPVMAVRLPQPGPAGPTARITLRVEERPTSEALARLVAKLDTLI